MTPKEYLSQYGWAERNIRRLEEEKERWHRRVLLESLKARIDKVKEENGT